MPQDPAAILEVVKSRLSQVIDPETNVDVMRMRLVENLRVDPAGRVSYTFRPSSPICPLAVTLASQIKEAVANVEGVSGQTIAVEGYVQAAELTELLNQ